MHLILFLIACLMTTQAYSFVCGNPAQPALVDKGVATFKNKVWSLRISFLDDYVYSQQFTGEFDVPTAEEKPPLITMASESAQLTLNFNKRLDVYGIAGSSRLELDEELFAKRQFSWGVGAKAVIFELDSLRVGADLKYFESKQKPFYLISEGLPINIESLLKFLYREYQGSFGISYESEIFCPYVNGTYINAKIDPNLSRFNIKIPGFDDLMDADIQSFVGKNSWGMAVGASLIMGKKGTLSVESRFFNQNAINATLELRF